jgi:hypothetical protein
MRAPELEIFSDLFGCLSTTLLGGWPLPALADGDALHITRTKGSSAVGVRKHWKEDSKNRLSGVSLRHFTGAAGTGEGAL